MSEVRVVDRGPVRTITIDRPASKNALTHEIALQIAGAITGVPRQMRSLQKRSPVFTGH